MRTYLHELLSITRIMWKTFPCRKLVNMSLLWAIGVFLCFYEHLGTSFVDNVILLYSPHNGKLVFLIAFYISLCIPMIYTILYMQSQISDEFVYSRMKGRSTIILAKILTVMATNACTIFAEIIIVGFLHQLCIGDISFNNSISVFFSIGIWKFLQKSILTLFLLLHQSCKKNVISLFLVLTGIIWVIAYGLLGNSGLWNYSSFSAGYVIMQYTVGIAVLLLVIIYRNYIGDISL